MAQLSSEQTTPMQSPDSVLALPLNPSLQRESLSVLRDETARRRPYAASAHPLDHRPSSRYRDFNTNTPQDTTYSQKGSRLAASHAQAVSSRRRRSIQGDSPGAASQLHKHAGPSQFASHGKFASSPFPGQSHQAADSESTVSTTAPSTVWDELDDIKSRIRNLELTGRLPASSNAAISGTLAERPTTANTTLTNTSLSPKHRNRKSVSPEVSTSVAANNSEFHPLLHKALAKSKAALDPSVSETLEATVLEALSLASDTNTLGSQAAFPGGIDRQLRRKVDNVCRNLMELCIVLAESKSNVEPLSSPAIPSPKFNSSPPKPSEVSPESRYIRAASEDPELRSSSRVMSRLEARRASLQASSGLNLRDSSQEPPAPLVGKLDRTASALRRRDHEDQEVIAKRPPSRANTEVGQVRPSAYSRMSREYVSNHPLPNHPQRSPSVQSSMPARKSYFSSTATSPATPHRTQSSSRRRLDESTPPSSTDSSRLAEARQRRLASLGQSDTIQSRQPLLNGRLRHAETEP